MHLAVEGLSKSYSGRPVLRDLTLDFEPGSVNILLGPNGAGKTTLLRLLDLLEAPDRGEVLIDGRPMCRSSFQERRRARRRMGFVFQLPMLLDGSLQSNLETALNIAGRRIDPAKMEAVLEQVGLADHKNTSALKLSGGEKQRLQLARVMLLDPELYLLDEPTSSLDPLNAREVERVVAAIARSGKTVILSTHNLLTARTVGDQFFFFRDGRLLQRGDGDTLFSRPVSIDIAEYSGGGNILDGLLEHGGSGCRFRSGELVLEVVSSLPDGPAAALIRPEDLLLSPEPLHSSARNSLLATVVSSQDLGIVLAVTVELARIFLTVFITRESFVSMGLKPGTPVWLTCKATSIHLMRTEEGR